MNKKKKVLFGILFVFFMILCTKLGIKLHNHCTVDEDTAPLIFVDTENDMLQLYYLQNEELIENPIGSDVYYSWAYTRYDINKEKREEILLKLSDYVPAKYNYDTDQLEKLGDNKEMEEIISLYNGEESEYRFIPGSNNISFTIYDRIYVYEYEQEQYKEVYQFNHHCYSMLGFSYEWKNDEEMYLIKGGNLVLYNIETKNEEIILEDIGAVYFQMSDDGQYITYQKQRGNDERRGIYLVNLHSMEQKKIYTAKTDFMVKAEFSPDNQYIFIRDYHWDPQMGGRYFYLYDINKEKKYRLDIDELHLGVFVGWGK